MSELVVLQHDPRTGPGGFTEVLEARTSLVPWRLVDLAAGDELPAATDLAGLISLGGPMGVVDAEPAAWQNAELDLLRGAVAAEVPVLGICLGSQLLATALGGRVERREVPEIGYLPLRRTEQAADEPVTAGWPDGTTALFVHRDEIRELPPEAEPLLLGSEMPAAWRSGSALGIQFHPEAGADLLATWVAGDTLPAQLERAGVDGEALLEEARRRERFTIAQGRALLGRFLDDPVRKRVQA